MLTIVGLLSFIAAVTPAPVNETRNTSYILATVLFYKDATKKIMLASGPVPEAAVIAISDDISSRLNDATVKVVPVFHEGKPMPNSSNIIDTIKNQYKTVFVTRVQKRLSRNIIKNWWNKLFNKMPTTRSQSLRTAALMFESITTPERPPDKSSEEAAALATVNKTCPCQDDDYEGMSTKKSKTKDPVLEEEELRFQEFFHDNEHSAEIPDPKRFRYFDQFVPNDIYYSVEKKCVNWADGCNQHSGSLSNMSSFSLQFGKPSFVKISRPIIE